MLAAALRDRDGLAGCAKRLEHLATGGSPNARAALGWVAGLQSLMDDDQDAGERTWASVKKKRCA